MVRARWELDENRGKGHTIDKSPTFSETLMTGYPIKLMNYIKENKPTNHDIFRFGLENGFLPKHTNEILKRWKIEGTVQVEIISLDGKPARSSYLDDPVRKVRFTIEKNDL